MEWLIRLNGRVAEWADRPHAVPLLAGLSFAESSFFPVPPDVLLAPMTLAHPSRGWHYATLVTIASVVGGLFGYLIGLYGMEMIAPRIEQWGFQSSFEEVRLLFDQYGIWIVLLAGFSPIPYKLFTITAGAMTMSLPLFLLASLIGRGARFYLVVAFVVWGGEWLLKMEREWMIRLGWILVVIALIYYLLWH
ncbi:MAG: DedA family protein [Gammaproteobacteria bacterium]|jgi:membrane protein YqaA with SNARE-associated domain|nr:DedA family protein [Gammaproteobacteria bacterium]MBT7308217.1 DedA family protein [Gammaproteobacteria bacterium]